MPSLHGDDVWIDFEAHTILHILNVKYRFGVVFKKNYTAYQRAIRVAFDGFLNKATLSKVENAIKTLLRHFS